MLLYCSFSKLWSKLWLGLQVRRLLQKTRVSLDQLDRIASNSEPCEPYDAASSLVPRDDRGSSSPCCRNGDDLPSDYQLPCIEHSLDKCTLYNNARRQASSRKHTRQLAQCRLTSTAPAIADSRPDTTSYCLERGLRGPTPRHIARCYSFHASQRKRHPLSSLWESQRILRGLALHLQEAGLTAERMGTSACATPGPMHSLAPRSLP